MSSTIITKEMRISGVIKNHPETYEIFLDFGLDCLSCMQAKYETIEQLSILHGIDLTMFLELLNDAAECREME